MTLAADRKKIRDAVTGLFNSLSPSGQEELRKAFSKIDSSKDGSVSKKELLRYIKNDVGWKIDQDRFQALWKLVDADDSGSLDFFEVGAVILLLQSTPQECDECEKIIFDDQLYACEDCWEDSLEEEYELMAGVYCMSCVKSGGKLHKHKLTLIANEWRKRDIEDWAISKNIIDEYEDEDEDEDEYETDDEKEESHPLPPRGTGVVQAQVAVGNSNTTAYVAPPYGAPPGATAHVAPYGAPYVSPCGAPPGAVVVVEKKSKSSKVGKLVKGVAKATLEGAGSVAGELAMDQAQKCAMQ